MTGKPAELLEVELLATDDERRPMGTQRLEYETARAESCADELASFIAELRRVKPEPRRRK